MFLQFIMCLAFFGVCSVNADDHGACATTEKVNEVNTLVTQITQALGPILMDQTKTEDQKFAMVLQGACNNASSGGVREHINSIEMKLANCSALLAKTTVMSLNLSAAFTFANMFNDFTGVDNFCECVPNLQQAMAMNTVKDQLMYTMTGAQYSVIKLSLLCSSMPIKTAVETVAADHLGKCKKVYKYAELLNDKDNVIVMKLFVDNVCSNFNDTKFMCAMQGSAENDFKSCITGITGDDMMKVKCGRNDCVEMKIDNSCGDGKTWYKWAVNMQPMSPNTFQLDDKECESGVTSIVASSGLLLVALFTMLFF